MGAYGNSDLLAIEQEIMLILFKIKLYKTMCIMSYTDKIYL